MICPEGTILIGGVWPYVIVSLFFGAGLIVRGMFIPEEYPRRQLRPEPYEPIALAVAIKNKICAWHRLNRDQIGAPFYLDPSDAYLLLYDQAEQERHAARAEYWRRPVDVRYAAWLKSTLADPTFYCYGHPILPKREHE